MRSGMGPEGQTLGSNRSGAWVRWCESTKRTGSGGGGKIGLSGGGRRGVIASSSEEGVRFSGVTVYSPDGRLLVKEVNLTALRRTFLSPEPTAPARRRCSGSWRSLGTHRRDHHPADVAGATDESFQVFYVPRKPYLVSGTLRDRVMPPAGRSGAR